MTDAPRPLDGLVARDLSTILAGPYCSIVLGNLGADVNQGRPARWGSDPAIWTAVRRTAASGHGRWTVRRSTSTAR